MSAICTLFAFAIMIYFTSASQPPNMLTAAHELFTYSYGYYNFAHVPLKYGGLFAILPLYGSAFGFMFASKHQLNAMACSGMLPALLAKRLGENRIPLYALLTTATAQYVVYLLGRLDKGFEFFPICGLFACMMYTGIFSSFIVFRTRFGNMHRHFINPLGIFGAVLGMLIFGYAVLTVVLLHDNYVWITFLVYVAIMIVYYYLHVESNQFFSKEEQDKFMKAYILNSKNCFSSFAVVCYLLLTSSFV